MLNLKRIFFCLIFFIFFLFLTSLLVSCWDEIITDMIESGKRLSFRFASDSVPDSLYDSTEIHDLGDTLILYAEITKEVEDAEFKAALDTFDLSLIDSDENIVTNHLHRITDTADSAFETDFFIGRFTIDTVGVFKLQAISRTTEEAFLEDTATIELQTGIKPVIDSITSSSGPYITVGDTLYFKAYVSKGTDPKYQWYKEDVLLNEAVGDLLLIEGVNDAHSGWYQCLVSNIWGEVYSDTINVQIIGAFWDTPKLDTIIEVSEGDTVTINLREFCKDPVDDSLVFSFVETPSLFYQLEDSLIICKPTFNDSGKYTLKVEVSDLSLVDTADFTIQVTNVNQAPKWDSVYILPPKEEKEGLAYLMKDRVSDPDGDVITITLDSTIYQGNKIDHPQMVNDLLLIDNDSLLLGVYRFYFTAADGFGSTSSKAFILIVSNNENQAPVWDSTVLVIPAIDENSSLQFYVGDLVADPEGGTVIISLDSTYLGEEKTGDAYIQGDTLKMSTDYSSAGNYIFYLTARDSGFLSAQQTLTLEVNDVNQLPVWSGDTVIPSIDENISLDFYVGDLVTDPGGEVITISLDSSYSGAVKIEGASILGDTLKMSTDYSSAGNYSFYLTARNSDLLSAQQALTLTVNNVNRAPVWSGDTVIPSIDENMSLDFYVGDLVTDPDGEVITISLDSTVLDAEKVENPAFTGDTLKLSANYHSAGDYNFYFSAFDGTDSTTRTFNLTVNNVGQTEFLAVKAGSWHTLILTNNNTLWATGDNSHGQLGDGSKENRLTPVYVKDSVKEISVGYGHSLIIRNDNTFWATGENGHGQLGNDTQANETTYVNIMSNIKAVSAGYYYSLILQQDNTFLAKGNNEYGQLGNYSSFRDVKAVFAGSYHTFILKNDNTLWGTGRNEYGQLGDGTTIDKSSFILIRGDIKTASSGYGHSLILTINDSLYATGFNNRGQLGMGIRGNRDTLVFIKNDIKAVSVGEGFSLVLNNGDSLYAAGANSFGQLGDGTATDRESLVFIMDNVKAISAGRYHSFIIKKDNTLWGTGDNRLGQLGDGTTENKSTFVQITF